MRKIILSTILIIIAVGGGYEPAPIIEPDGVAFDPNQALSSVMAAYKCYTNETIKGEIEVAEPDSEQVTLTADKLIFGTVIVKDPNVSIHKWSWIPGEADSGINYLNITATDPQGLSDSRTIVIEVLINHKPVITGCRRN